MATTQQQQQYDVLWLTTEGNPLLPVSPVPTLNKSLATNSKQVIKAINEVLKNGQGTQASLDSFINNFNTFVALIGDTYADSTLSPKLTSIADNVILALDSLSNAIKSLEETIVDKADSSVTDEISKSIIDINESISSITDAINTGTIGSGSGGSDIVGQLIKTTGDATVKPYIIIPVPDGSYVDEEKVNVYQLASKSYCITNDYFKSGNFTDEQKANFNISGGSYTLNKAKVTGDYALLGNDDFVLDAINETTTITTNGGQTYGGQNVFPIYSIDKGATWNYIEASTTAIKKVDFNNLADVKAKNIPFSSLNSYFSRFFSYMKMGIPIRFGWVFDYAATTAQLSIYQYPIYIGSSYYTFVPRTQNSGTTLTTNYTISKQDNNLIIFVTNLAKYYIEMLI